MHIPPHVSPLKSAATADKRLVAEKKKKTSCVVYTQTLPQPAVYEVILHFADLKFSTRLNITSEL